MSVKKLYKGIALMLISSMFTCTGQLCWKLSAQQDNILYLLLGFCLYGFGALLMILALRYGELSILHPMMSVGYILSLFMGSIVLHEEITAVKVIGVLVIISGLIILSLPERNSIE